MRTIRLATAYQLVLTSLLVGACLGTVGQRIPETFTIPVQSVQAKAATEELGPLFSGAPVTHTFQPTVQATIMDRAARFSQASTRYSASDAAVTERARRTEQPTAVQQHTTAAVDYPFILTEQRQHGEQIVPRLYLYVHDQEQGLGNFTVHVQKDGVTLPVNAKTFGGTPGYTWPMPHVRQHLTNLKLEFPDVPAAGVWEIQLVDSGGTPVGPIAHFSIAPDDRNKEMYVRYEAQ